MHNTLLGQVAATETSVMSVPTLRKDLCGGNCAPAMSGGGKGSFGNAALSSTGTEVQDLHWGYSNLGEAHKGPRGCEA